MNVTPGRYILGIASLAVLFAAMALAGVALRRRLLPEWTGAPARLAESLIGVSVLIAILEVLGTLGLFRLMAIVAVCAAVGAAAAWELRRTRVARRRALAPTGLLAAGVAVVAGALVAAAWAPPVLDSYDLGMHAFDTLWYHMPWAASFAQTGRVTSLHYDLEFLLAFYPATAELFHGLGIVLLGRDTLSPVINVGWMGMAMLAAWCIGRPRGRAAAAAAGVALVLLTPMMDFSQPGSADGDVVGLAFLLAAVALILNADAQRGLAPYALAAIAAGFAMSIKLTFLAPVALLTVGVLVSSSGGRRRATALAWVIPLLLAGGFWYLRNLVAIGNPLPWSRFGGVLPVPEPPIQHHVNFAVAHYLTSSVFWKHFFVRGMAGQLGSWWYLVAVAAVVGPLLCLLPGSDRRLRMLALVALGSLAAYLVTPNGAIGPDGDPVGFTYNLRYAAPGLALAYALTPLAPAFAGARRQAALIVGLAAIAAATLAHASLWPSPHVAGAMLVGGVALLGGLLLSGLRARSLRGRPIRAAALVAVALLACAGAAAGYPWQRHYLRGRYVFQPQISHLSGVWSYFRRVHHSSVAVAGTYGEFFSYPLYGSDDSNRVVYVAARGPHGSYTRIRTCRDWRTAVNRGHFRYLLSTPERDFWRPDQLRPAPERAWVLGDPAAHVVFERHVTGEPVDLFELSGPLDPNRCPRASG